jgi:hypothetical protein
VRWANPRACPLQTQVYDHRVCLLGAIERLSQKGDHDDGKQYTVFLCPSPCWPIRVGIDDPAQNGGAGRLPSGFFCYTMACWEERMQSWE